MTAKGKPPGRLPENGHHFQPFRTLKHEKIPTFNSFKENTSATPPPTKYEGTVQLTIGESLHIQEEIARKTVTKTLEQQLQQSSNSVSFENLGAGSIRKQPGEES